jgi:hypothetical protein
MKPFMIRALTVVLALCTVALRLSCDCLCSEKRAAKVPLPPPKPADVEPGKPWNLAVSGDSRNCGVHNYAGA